MLWLIFMLIGDGLEMLNKLVGPALDGIMASLGKAASSSSTGAHLAQTVGTISAPPNPAWLLAFTMVLCVLDIVAVAGVFYWKRWGFYVSVVASGILFAINLVNGTGVVNSLCYLVSPFLLYATLRLGGENCGWRRLK